MPHENLTEWQEHPIYIKQNASYVVTLYGNLFHVPNPEVNPESIPEFGALFDEVSAYAQGHPEQVAPAPEPPPYDRYINSRIGVGVEMYPVLQAIQSTHAAEALKTSQDGAVFELLGDEYSDDLANMKAKFDAINDQFAVTIVPATPPPDEAGLCKYCSELMDYINVTVGDQDFNAWRCPICGRYGSGDELHAALNIDLAASLNASVAHYLNLFAQQKGYDTIFTAMQAASSAVFKADGEKAVAAYDEVWTYVIDNDLTAQVVAKEISVREAIDLLPDLSWT